MAIDLYWENLLGDEDFNNPNNWSTVSGGSSPPASIASDDICHINSGAVGTFIIVTADISIGKLVSDGSTSVSNLYLEAELTLTEASGISNFASGNIVMRPNSTGSNLAKLRVTATHTLDLTGASNHNVHVLTVSGGVLTITGNFAIGTNNRDRYTSEDQLVLEAGGGVSQAGFDNLVIWNYTTTGQPIVGTPTSTLSLRSLDIYTEGTKSLPANLSSASVFYTLFVRPAANADLTADFSNWSLGQGLSLYAPAGIASVDRPTIHLTGDISVDQMTLLSSSGAGDNYLDVDVAAGITIAIQRLAMVFYTANDEIDFNVNDNAFTFTMSQGIDATGTFVGLILRLPDGDYPLTAYAELDNIRSYGGNAVTFTVATSNFSASTAAIAGLTFTGAAPVLLTDVNVSGTITFQNAAKWPGKTLTAGDFVHAGGGTLGDAVTTSTLTVSGTGVINGTPTVQNVDASGGQAIAAYSGPAVDGGGNLNILFIAPPAVGGAATGKLGLGLGLGLGL